MGKSLHNTVSTSGGEWSPKLDARVDHPKYSTALRQCLNMIPYKSGGLTRRIGTQFMGKTVYANTPGHNYAVRLVAFTFSPDTTFMLEFGHQYIRFYSNGLQVQVASADIWSTIVIYFQGTFVTYLGLIYYKYSPGTVTGVTPLSDPSDWRQQTAYEVPTPYNADAGSGSIFDTDVFTIFPCQINDVVYIASPVFPPYSLKRIADNDWTMNEVAFQAPALLDQNATDTTITPSALQGDNITLVATAPAWIAHNYYTLGSSVEVMGVIYNCIQAHVSGVGFSGGVKNNGLWVAVTIFDVGHIGSTWQLAVVRQADFVEYDGVAATGFSDGISDQIQCIGSFTVQTYGVWSSDVAIERSLDGGNTWVTVISITSRNDNNVSTPGTADVLGIYRIVVSNSSVPPAPGATDPRVVFTCDSGFLYGTVQITGVVDAYNLTASVITQLSDSIPLGPQWFSGYAYTAGDTATYAFINYTCTVNVTSATPPPGDSTHWSPTAPGGTEYWSEAAWSNAYAGTSQFRGFPRTVTSFQQRMIYAGSSFEPQRIWGTVTNDIENFALGDQTKATDSFAFDLNAPSRGPILWLISQTDLFAGFFGAEWVINSGSTSTTSGNSGAAITPTNINAFEQGSFGSAPYIQPAIVGNAVFFVQRQADAIRQMLFSVYTEKYMSHDLTGQVDHFFSSGIVQLAYQSRWRHQSVIWAVTQQGTLCGLTYDLDQEVFGWCRAQTGYSQFSPDGAPITPDNGFESVAIIDSKGSGDDQVWVVANRLIGGVQTRLIERMNPVNWEEVFSGAPNPPAPDLTQAYYVDCGTTITNPGSLTLSGLSYLEGRYVVGLADGSPFGPLLVSGGQVVLPASIPSTVKTVQIGLPIAYAGQPMRFDPRPKGRQHAGDQETNLGCLSPGLEFHRWLGQQWNLNLCDVGFRLLLCGRRLCHKPSD